MTGPIPGAPPGPRVGPLNSPSPHKEAVVGTRVGPGSGRDGRGASVAGEQGAQETW